jgi:hypothetical protein
MPTQIVLSEADKFFIVANSGTDPKIIAKAVAKPVKLVGEYLGSLPTPTKSEPSAHPIEHHSQTLESAALRTISGKDRGLICMTEGISSGGDDFAANRHPRQRELELAVQAQDYAAAAAIQAAIEADGGSAQKRVDLLDQPHIFKLGTGQ